MCNADCSYCSTPPDGSAKWTIDDFKRYFDSVAPRMSGQAIWLWHGGEPMLMSPEFYFQAFEYARSIHPQVRFSMQSNILGYSTKKWKDILTYAFGRSISTSYDPDELNRTVKGSPETFHRLFFKKHDQMLEDGFRPSMIGTYTKNSMHLADKVYEMSLAKEDKSFSVRFNYRYPVGRSFGDGESINPEDYGKMLLKMYNRWIVDNPPFKITPLDEMLGKTLGFEAGRCPWTNSCGGRFITIDPDGSVYNCGEFSSLGQSLKEEGKDDIYCYGNLNDKSIDDLLSSKAAMQMRRRRVVLPKSCQTCRHFNECEGGCARDSVLFDRGMGGKFYYCASWLAVFDRIKESILTKEADALIISKYNVNPDAVREQLLVQKSNQIPDMQWEQYIKMDIESKKIIIPSTSSKKVIPIFLGK